MNDDDTDVIILTETWANNNLLNSELFPSDYIVFRSDRQFGRGGGVLVGVKSLFRCDMLNIDSDPDLIEYNIDLLCTKLVFSNKLIYIIVTYIPPSTPAFMYEHLVNKLELLNLFSENTLLIGDFNVPDLSDMSCPKSHILNNFAVGNDLVQINNVKNHNNRTLDLAFCSAGFSHSCVHTLFPYVPEDPHHPALTLSVTYNVTHFKKFKYSEAPRFNFKRANYIKLYDLLLVTNWSSVVECDDVDQACNVLYNIINGYFEECIPVTAARNSSFPLWYSFETRRLIRVKRHYLNLSRSSALREYKDKFRDLRKQVRYSIERDFKLYIDEVNNSIQADPRKLWSFINNRRGETRIPGSMLDGDTCID